MLKLLQRYHSKTERLCYQATIFGFFTAGFTFLQNLNRTGNKTFSVSFLVNKVTSGHLQTRCIQGLRTILNMAVILYVPKASNHNTIFTIVLLYQARGVKKPIKVYKPTLEDTYTEILRKRFPSILLNEKKALVCCVVKDWCVARSGGALILLQRPVPESCFLNSCLGNKGHAVTWA